MKNLINLQPVQKSELPTLLQIAKTTFVNNYVHLNDPKSFAEYVTENFNLTKFTEEFTNSESAFFFAKMGNNICGYLKLNWGEAQTDQQLENAVEIERIYVLKHFQGQNVGKLMVEKSLEIAKTKNSDWLWLGVWERNPKAIGFYEKVGFEVFGEHVFMLGTERQIDILMRQRIELQPQ